MDHLLVRLHHLVRVTPLYVLKSVKLGRLQQQHLLHSGHHHTSFEDPSLRDPRQQKLLRLACVEGIRGVGFATHVGYLMIFPRRRLR